MHTSHKPLTSAIFATSDVFNKWISTSWVHRTIHLRRITTAQSDDATTQKLLATPLTNGRHSNSTLPNGQPTPWKLTAYGHRSQLTYVNGLNIPILSARIDLTPQNTSFLWRTVENFDARRNFWRTQRNHPGRHSISILTNGQLSSMDTQPLNETSFLWRTAAEIFDKLHGIHIILEFAPHSI